MEHYAVHDLTSEKPFALSSTAFTHFCHDAKLLCEHVLTPAAAYRVFLQSNVEDLHGDRRRNAVNDDKQLMRHEMLEAVLRLVECKFHHAPGTDAGDHRARRSFAGRDDSEDRAETCKRRMREGAADPRFLLVPFFQNRESVGT